MTDRQKEVLALIATLQRRAGPSVREVARILDVAPNSVQRMVERLREEGALAPDSGDGVVLAELQKVVQPSTNCRCEPVKVVQPNTRDRAPLFKPNGRL